MYIPQKQLDNIRALAVPGKVVVIYGPRRTGKTRLLNEFMKTESEPALFVNGDDINVRDYLASQSIERLRAFVGSSRLLVIDEAQRIPDIGLNLKLVIDNIPDVRVIATGSSSFDLARGTGEPLTGRKYTVRLYPLAQMEIAGVEPRHETDASLESRLLFGSYPEIVLMKDNRARQKYLTEVVSSYLYKDILELEGVRHASKISRLLQMIAFQIGHEISCSELGTALGMSKNTVDRYLDLLEKAFVLLRLSGFNRNLRSEITKNSRYYFLDNGVRNAIINNFNLLQQRDDVGALWENYLMVERLKRQEYLDQPTNRYFWRTYGRSEIDLVEDRGGQLSGFEFKWGPSSPSAPREWQTAYPDATYQVINRANYLDFIC